MNLVEIVLAVVRRWYVSVAVLALTAYGASVAWQGSTAVYSSSSMLAVVPSQSFMQVRAATGTGESSLGNPFGFTASATLTALLSDAINYGAIDLPPEAAGTGLSVATTNETRGSAFLTVTAVGPSREGVVAALTALDTGAPQALIAIQEAAGAPSDQVFTAYRTRGIPTPAEQYPNRQRSTLGIVLVGLLVTALAAVVVDNLAKRRRDAKERRAAEADLASAPDDAYENDDLVSSLRPSRAD